jgi:hypothetical protein
LKVYGRHKNAIELAERIRARKAEWNKIKYLPMKKEVSLHNKVYIVKMIKGWLKLSFNTILT